MLAAVAAGDEAPAAILVGPAGQLYAPDGHGAWLRTRAGGIGNPVLVAARVGAGVLVGADGAPPYRFTGEAWASVYLAQHAKAVVARGTRPLAAVGRQVFLLDHGAEPAKLPDAPAAVLAIGATAGGVAIATAHGVARLEAGHWQPIGGAPAGVTVLASERWAITAAGAFDLRTGALTAWPAGADVTAVALDGDALVAAVASSAGVDVLTIAAATTTRGAHAAGLARESVPLAPAGVPVGLAVDREHRAVIALRDGRVLVRARAGWTTTTVRDALPAARPGPPAAVAK